MIIGDPVELARDELRTRLAGALDGVTNEGTAARVVLDLLAAHPILAARALGVTMCANCLTARDAVLALHAKRYPAFQGTVTCATCGGEWPCPTVRAVGSAA